MNIKLEPHDTVYELTDKLMIFCLRDLLDTINRQPNLTHPDDIHMYKKLRKAAITLINYYEG